MKTIPIFYASRIYFLFTILLLAASDRSTASHIIGAELTYRHISGSIYRMHAVYFRDCSGIPAPTTVMLQVSSFSCNVNQTYTLLPIPGTPQEITLPCQGTFTTCQGGTALGFEKWEYELDIPIAGQCVDWLFATSFCCRSAAITTLQNPSSEELFVYARLNNLNGDNNSPQFTNNPFPIVALNQELHYNNGMFDPDGDSLGKSLVCPRTDINTLVNYNPGYDQFQFLSSNPPVTFDQFTGNLFMNPSANEFPVVAFEIQDYRNGEIVGSVVRDLAFYILPGNDTNPTATHMNGTAQQFAYVFPADTICFDIFSDDPDAGNSITMTWNQTIPAAAFTTTGFPFPTGTFCWTPALNDVRAQPYMFTCMVQDNNCPLNQAGIYSYFIYVTLDSSLVFLNTNDPGSGFYFKVSPNPSGGIFTIQSSEHFSQLNIYNVLGECILQKGSEELVDLSNRPSGIYFIKAKSPDGGMVVKKIVKN